MTEELSDEIKNGLFDGSERFLMASEIRRRYQTSYATALKVMEELIRRKLVFRRKGFVYVNREAASDVTIPESATCKILLQPKKPHHLGQWQNRFIPAVQSCLLEQNVSYELVQAANWHLNEKNCNCLINVNQADAEEVATDLPSITLAWNCPAPDTVFVDYRRCFDEIINYFFSCGVHELFLCAATAEQGMALRAWIRHNDFLKNARNYHISADELSFIPIDSAGRQPDFPLKPGVKCGILSPDASCSHALRQRLQRRYHAGDDFEIVTLAALPEECWYLDAHVCLDDKQISQAVLKQVARKIQTGQRLPAHIIAPELKIGNG